MLQNSVGILLRFCLNKIAVVSDIEKAFLQIGLQDNAKNATRFFWLKDKNILETDNNIQTYRFCRLPFGIIASPFLLTATIDHHLQTVGTSMAENIRQNIYVDNVVTGTNSVHEALGFYSESKKIFEGAAMNLRDWTSNIKEVLDKIPLYDQTNSQDLKEIPSHCFPRCIGLNQSKEIKYQLLVLCDACKCANAAAVYLRQEIQENGIKDDLIFTKTRLVPNKQITIPRLELLAATIGVRSIKFVQKELR